MVLSANMPMASASSGVPGFLLVRAYESVWEASIDAALLEAEGIDTRTLDSETISVDWALHRAIGGVKLVVAEEHVDRARELLGEIAHPPTAVAPDWVDPAEHAARQLQVLGLLTFATGGLLVVYFLPCLWKFRREHAPPVPAGRASRADRRRPGRPRGVVSALHDHSGGLALSR